VAATLFDEVISRVSVLSAILTDQGGDFMGEVVECLLHRLGISHLRTSAYHAQTDAKCERAHFSVHNIITKLNNDKHERWPDLLGTVLLAYNATVHTSTGYSPHELFYSFAPSCLLDVFESVHTSSVANFAVNNVSMPRKHNSMPDVEPSSSEGEQTDGKRGKRSAQASDASETAVKRLAESSASPMAAVVHFNATGGAYTRRRAPLRAGGNAVLPPPRRHSNGVRDRAGCHSRTRKSSVIRNVSCVTTSTCSKHIVV